MQRNHVRDAIFGMMNHGQHHAPSSLDEQRMMYMYQGLNCVLKLLNQHLDTPVNPQSSTDVLGAATTAYQQGKITKSQLMAVIDALDEQTYQTRAYAVPDSTDLTRRF